MIQFLWFNFGILLFQSSISFFSNCFFTVVKVHRPCSRGFTGYDEAFWTFPLLNISYFFLLQFTYFPIFFSLAITVLLFAWTDYYTYILHSITMYMSSIIFKKKWEQSKSSHTLFHRILSLSLHGEPRPASQLVLLVLVLVLVLIFVPFLHWLTVTRSWCQTLLHFIPDFLPCQLLICGHLCC